MQLASAIHSKFLESGVSTGERYLLGKTVVWRIDVYLDVVFIIIARNCDSNLWWASFACFVIVNVILQMLLMNLFVCTDCDHQMPGGMGFLLYDF